MVLLCLFIFQKIHNFFQYRTNIETQVISRTSQQDKVSIQILFPNVIFLFL